MDKKGLRLTYFSIALDSPGYTGSVNDVFLDLLYVLVLPNSPNNNIHLLLVDVYLGHELYYRKVMMNTTYNKESVMLAGMKYN